MKEYEFSTPPIGEDPSQAKDVAEDGYYLDEPAQQQEFSIAYVHAVASAAGYSIHRPAVDKDSIDLFVKQHTVGKRVPLMEQLNVQAKCSYYHTPRENHLPYPIKKKNFNDLCETRCAIPRILIVVHVPRDFGTWVRHDTTSMILQHNAYWHTLRGEEPIVAGSKRIHIPLMQQFTVSSLRQIMNRLAMGAMP